MPKHSFVNCKSRKRKKVNTPISKPKDKLFCPRTMVRYDQTQTGYITVWVCKLCRATVLSPTAVEQHLTRCNIKINRAQQLKDIAKKNKDTKDYICEHCNKMFSRRVALKKHLEKHKNSSSSESSEPSDSEVKDDSLMTDDGKDNNDKPEEESAGINTDLI